MTQSTHPCRRRTAALWADQARALAVAAGPLYIGARARPVYDETVGLWAIEYNGRCPS